MYDLISVLAWLPMLIPFVLIFIVLPIAVIRWLWRNGRK